MYKINNSKKFILKYEIAIKNIKFINKLISNKFLNKPLEIKK